MTAPQIIILVLIAVDLLITAHLHGKPRTGTWSFGLTLFSNAVTLGLLYWGGFFQ